MIEVNNVNKNIKGNQVLCDISCCLNAGNVYGIYGRNGSGKTMLMRCILGLIYPDSGYVKIDGSIIGKETDFPKSVGAIIENPAFFAYATGYENLKMLADIKKLISEKRIRDTMQKVGLNDMDKRNVAKYSLGMKQRLAIAQAIMESPEILVLDEPTNALDEQGIEIFRNIIKEEKERGTLIILASHNKEDIELLADIKIHMDNGRIKEIISNGERNEGEKYD